jgi:hypothetical protein
MNMATMTHNSVSFQATRARNWFHQIQRKGDTNPPEAGRIWTRRDDLGILPKTRAEGLSSAVHLIDGSLILPDDWKYLFLVEALDMIAESDALDVDEMREQFMDDLPDERRHLLLSWYDSHGFREAYIDDEALEHVAGLRRNGYSDIITTTLQWGINAERVEVFELVWDWLREEADRA